MVLIALGSPDSKQSSDGREQWVYEEVVGESSDFSHFPISGHNSVALPELRYGTGERVTFQRAPDGTLRVVSVSGSLPLYGN